MEKKNPDKSPHSPETVESLLENCRQILAEDELKLILAKAFKVRQAEINLKKYNDGLKQSVTWPRYSSEQLMERFDQQYSKVYGVPFIRDEFSTPVLEALCLYFTNDKRFEKLREGYSLNKGLLLQGPIGCGKSSVMRLFCNNPKQSYQYTECSKLAREFSKSAYENYTRYTNPALNPSPGQKYWGHEYLGWYFDDLGFEVTGKHYGKTTNYMMEIIQGIESNLGLMAGKTHFSTNLTADEIEEFYSKRIRSRMRMMYNTIIYDEEAPDRRK